MTINRKAFQTPPKLWHAVMWTYRGPNAWARREDAKKWCREHAGVFQGDWYITPSIKERTWIFKFRDANVALLFQLTWT